MTKKCNIDVGGSHIINFKSPGYGQKSTAYRTLLMEIFGRVVGQHSDPSPVIVLCKTDLLFLEIGVKQECSLG